MAESGFRGGGAGRSYGEPEQPTVDDLLTEDERAVARFWRRAERASEHEARFRARQEARGEPARMGRYLRRHGWRQVR